MALDPSGDMEKTIKIEGERERGRERGRGRKRGSPDKGTTPVESP